MCFHRPCESIAVMVVGAEHVGSQRDIIGILTGTSNVDDNGTAFGKE